jgi:hypothetical protein
VIYFYMMEIGLVYFKFIHAHLYPLVGSLEHMVCVLFDQFSYFITLLLFPLLNFFHIRVVFAFGDHSSP